MYRAARFQGGAWPLITVAIVDDHPLTRTGVERSLEAAPGVRVSCSVGSLLDLEAARPVADVVILDLYLSGEEPDLDSVTALSERTHVLVFSASGRGRDVLAAIEAGAAGYITKQATDESLLVAVRAVASGAFYLSSQLADIMHAEVRRRTEQRNDPGLSAREEEALRLVAEGFTHQQGATRMGVSPSTFDTYVRRVREKLSLGNKAELTRKAIELGLGTESDPGPPS